MGGTADPLFFYILMYLTIGLNVRLVKEKEKNNHIYKKFTYY